MVLCRYPRMSNRGVCSWRELLWIGRLHLFSFFLSLHQDTAHPNMKKLIQSLVFAVKERRRTGAGVLSTAVHASCKRPDSTSEDNGTKPFVHPLFLVDRPVGAA